jgi:hypothetical protein
MEEEKNTDKELLKTTSEESDKIEVIAASVTLLT